MPNSVNTSTSINQNIVQLHPGSIHGSLARPAVVHIVGWRLSTCNLQPVHQNPAHQWSTASIPQAGTPLSHRISFIRPLKTPNIGIEISSTHYPSARTVGIIQNQLLNFIHGFNFWFIIPWCWKIYGQHGKLESTNGEIQPAWNETSSISRHHRADSCTSSQNKKGSISPQADMRQSWLKLNCWKDLCRVSCEIGFVQDFFRLFVEGHHNGCRFRFAQSLVYLVFLATAKVLKTMFGKWFVDKFCNCLLLQGKLFTTDTVSYCSQAPLKNNDGLPTLSHACRAWIEHQTPVVVAPQLRCPKWENVAEIWSTNDSKASKYSDMKPTSSWWSHQMVSFLHIAPREKKHAIQWASRSASCTICGSYEVANT